jgi:hypothetical protein
VIVMKIVMVLMIIMIQEDNYLMMSQVQLMVRFNSNAI